MLRLLLARDLRLRLFREMFDLSLLLFLAVLTDLEEF